MKSSKSNLITLVALVAVALPGELAAQHARYKLIDIGTFGGANSSPTFQPFFDFTTAQNLSSTGTFVGQAEFSTPGTCFLNEDCLVQHAFQWRNGVLTDLGSLAEGLSSAAEWIGGNGLVAGVSEYIDPATSALESRAVLWDLACSVDAQGKPLPGVTQVAVQGGQYAAKAILCKVKRQPELAPFQYSDKGSLAVIGRWAAVANASGVHLSGLLAWIVWACMHVMNLVTIRNRLLVFIQWAFEDLTFSRGGRLITGTAPTDFSFDKEVAIHAGALKMEPETAAAPR